MLERDEVEEETSGTPEELSEEEPPQGAEPASDEGSEASSADDGTATVEILPSETDRLRQQLEEASARLRAVSKAYKDLQSEMDAFRKRQQVLAEAKAEKRAGQVVERFFEPVQNLKRAVEQEGATGDDLKAGVEMVLKQFMGRMDELGLAEIPGVGSDFNPEVHDALAQMPVTDAALNGKVIEVYASGWKVGDRVIQPAQVIVGSYQAPADA